MKLGQRIWKPWTKKLRKATDQREWKSGSHD
jgi:hypothetical protein